MPVKHVKSDTWEACQECHLSTDGNEVEVVEDEHGVLTSRMLASCIILLHETSLFDYRL